jgi:hypothetical protein
MIPAGETGLTFQLVKKKKMRIDHLENSRRKNRKLSRELFADKITAIENCINTQNDYWMTFGGFVGQAQFSGHSDAEAPILSAIVKNEFALYSSLILTIDGLYGAGLSHLRSVYEALMIAKYSSIKGSDEQIDRWLQARQSILVIQF